MANDFALRKKLYQTSDPSAPVPPDSPLAVDLDSVRGDSASKLLIKELQMASAEKPIIRLLAGHQGSGKSSELLRLERALRTTKPGEGSFHVVRFDVSEHLDLNDLDFPELLVLIADRVQASLAQGESSAVASYVSRKFEEIKSLLQSDVQLTDASVSVPEIADFTFTLRSNPTKRDKLRAAMDRILDSIMALVNDFLEEALLKLRQRGLEGLVLIIDGLDKLVLRDLPGGSTTHERLFVHRAAQFRQIKAHIIMTVPIGIVYTPACQLLTQAAGTPVAVVPMIPLRADKKSETIPGTTPGMLKLVEIVERRCKEAGLTLDQAFDEPKTLQELCKMSGGDPRTLMSLLRASISRADSLPIPREAVNAVVKDEVNSLIRQIPSDLQAAICEFHRPVSKSDFTHDDIHLKLLYHLYVMEYPNEHPWYEVNPLIRPIPWFARGCATAQKAATPRKKAAAQKSAAKKPAPAKKFPGKR